MVNAGDVKQMVLRAQGRSGVTEQDAVASASDEDADGTSSSDEEAAALSAPSDAAAVPASLNSASAAVSAPSDAAAAAAPSDDKVDAVPAPMSAKSASAPAVPARLKPELDYNLLAAMQHMLQVCSALQSMVKHALNNYLGDWETKTVNLARAGCVDAIMSWLLTVIECRTGQPLPSVNTHVASVLKVLEQLLDSDPWFESQDDYGYDGEFGSVIAVRFLVSKPKMFRTMAMAILPQLKSSTAAMSHVSTGADAQSPDSAPQSVFMPPHSDAEQCTAVVKLVAAAADYMWDTRVCEQVNVEPEIIDNVCLAVDKAVAAGVVLAVQSGLVTGVNAQNLFCRLVWPVCLGQNDRWKQSADPLHAWALGAMARVDLANLVRLALTGQLAVETFGGGHLAGLRCPENDSLEALLGKRSPFLPTASAPPSEAAIAAMTSFLCNGTHDATLSSPANIVEKHRPDSWRCHEVTHVSLQDISSLPGVELLNAARKHPAFAIARKWLVTLGCAVTKFVEHQLASDPTAFDLSQAQLVETKLPAFAFPAVLHMDSLRRFTSRDAVTETHSSYGCSVWLFAADHAAGCRACKRCVNAASAAAAPASDASAAAGVGAMEIEGDEAAAAVKNEEAGDDDDDDVGYAGIGTEALNSFMQITAQTRATTERYARAVLPGPKLRLSDALPDYLAGHALDASLRRHTGIAAAGIRSTESVFANGDLVAMPITVVSSLLWSYLRLRYTDEHAGLLIQLPRKPVADYPSRENGASMVVTVNCHLTVVLHALHVLKLLRNNSSAHVSMSGSASDAGVEPSAHKRPRSEDRSSASASSSADPALSTRAAVDNVH